MKVNKAKEFIDNILPNDVAPFISSSKEDLVGLLEMYEKYLKQSYIIGKTVLIDRPEVKGVERGVIVDKIEENWTYYLLHMENNQALKIPLRNIIFFDDEGKSNLVVK